MSMFYSESLGGFLDDGIHSVIPEDAVPLTQEEYIALLDGQSEGKVITAKKGKPVLAEPKGPTKAEKADAAKEEIYRSLEEIDAESVRSIRALLADPDSKEDRAKLVALEAKAAGLRIDLVALK